jgi:hypothetical protein
LGIKGYYCMAAASERRAVIRFPGERTGHPARGGASTWEVAKSRLREWLGRLANRFGAPGAIQPTKIRDQLTGQQISVAVSALSVRLTVDGRDYYFDRLSGRFNGSGSTV